MPAASSRHDPALDARPLPTYPARADLHTHSSRSDGVLAPLELARQAAAAGVSLLALTDHDTLAGAREVLADARRPADLEIVVGVEINAVAGGWLDLEDGELHVIGLGVDPADEPLEALLARQRQRRRVRFDRLVSRLRELGLAVDDALEAARAATDDDALGRPTVARALVAKGHAATVSDAFDRLLSRGRPAYVPREGIGPMEAIAAVRAAGGLPILAHFAEAAERRAVVAELAQAGLAGIEVHYRAYTADEVASVGRVAAELNLLASGGTDFHGDRETYAQAHAALWLPDDVGATAAAAIAATRTAQ
jgi:hypothetical protein